MAELAADPQIEGRVGRSHDVWVAAPNRELAWDEARAHFFSVLLTRQLDLPRSPTSFGDDQSRNVRQTVPAAGEVVEGVAASAMLSYYAAIGHSRAEEVARDFLGTQDFCAARAGHPPRTSSEFFAQERTRVNELASGGTISAADAARRQQALDRVSRDYRINF